MKIGVLALQGDFQEHELALRKIGVEAVEVRLSQDLEGLDGLIIPGGESTSIGKLATTFNLIDPLKQFAKTTPVWGTCGGLVFMAKEVGFDQPILGVLDMVVERNAFGRQVDSFEEDLDIKGIEGGPFHGVFIRAPEVKEVGPSIEILCRVEDGRIVAVRNGHLLATSFHPELTDDLRLHRYFVEIVAKKAR
ncbi:MAG: pyridoxal 5'-phosphate synthase glutaminase subunit PdxT [Thermodesulfobacteriota bacterium]